MNDGLVPPTIDDIRAAGVRIGGKAVRTPVVESPLLNERLGLRCLVKAESLQLTGSFKFRGAYNRISQIPDAQRGAGVVAYSTGNHAQGVAAAARYTGLPAVIVVPNDIPAIKKANTLAWGAELAFYQRNTEDREAVAARIAGEKGGAVIVPPFDDPDIIAGQGTIGLEFIEQARDMGAGLDAVVIPAGGGGLTAGIATAIKAASPETKIFMAEPADYDDTLRSLAAGERVANELGPDTPGTFCDALTAPMPGEITFEINRRLVAGVLTMPDATVAKGIYAAFTDLKLVLEPSGAIALAALVAGLLGERFDTAGKTIGIVASGGNVDPEIFVQALKDGAPEAS